MTKKQKIYIIIFSTELVWIVATLYRLRELSTPQEYQNILCVVVGSLFTAAFIYIVEIYQKAVIISRSIRKKAEVSVLALSIHQIFWPLVFGLSGKLESDTYFVYWISIVVLLSSFCVGIFFLHKTITLVQKNKSTF